MSDFVINDRILQKECEALAKEIFEEYSNEDERQDAVHEWVDGHQWVIYNYRALRTVVECDVSDGEEFLEDVGLPETVTIYSLASSIVYGEMRARISEALQEMEYEREALEDA